MALLDGARLAFTHALAVTLTVCAVVCAAMSVVTAVALRRTPERRSVRRRPEDDRVVPLADLRFNRTVGLSSRRS